ncbi:MAG: 3-phosphoglycerate dehydrogenase [wastewater metagenome]|nr:3-phosphoglycerate dehydrogenase [Candidatus Loosdrechtia aerotolerans]
MKIIFPDPIDLTEEHIKTIEKLGGVVIFYDNIPGSESDVLGRISDADVIIPNWIPITAHIIQNAPSLRFIIVPAVGYESVDVKAASSAGIMVVNCPTHNSRAVAEYTIALLFSLTRRIIEANTDFKYGEWNPIRYTGIELKDKKLGLIGYGTIGKIVGQLALNIGMKVSYANSKTPADELDKLLASSDIISLHLPLTDKTRHLIDERRLQLMRRDAYLINTARGAIIDQKALIKVLKSGHLSGAALDVFENEPHGGKPSQELLVLAHYRNVIATPHIAFNTSEAVYRLGEELIANIKSIRDGNPMNVILP